MKKQVYKHQKDVSNKRAFYIALGVCLLAIGVALYIGVTTTMQELERDTLNAPSQNQTSSGEDVANVNGTTDDIPVMERSNSISKADNSKSSASTIENAPDNKAQQNNAIDKKSEKAAATQSDVKDPAATQPNAKAPAATQPNAKAPAAKESAKAQKAQQFSSPLEGDLLNPFSGGELVKSKTLMEWRTHDGVDIKSAANTPVKSVCDGKIEEIIEDAMWGVCVIVSHENAYQSMYFGLKPNVPVKKGASVKLGDIVGYVGNTAEIEVAEESHLHFAMKKSGAWIDPMTLIK